MGVPSKDAHASLEQNAGAGFIPARAYKPAMHGYF
jgi:hypothetical protein